jgi:hypothetical protein
MLYMFFHCVNKLNGFFKYNFVEKMYIDPLESAITKSGNGDKKLVKTISLGKIN